MLHTHRLVNLISHEEVKTMGFRAIHPHTHVSVDKLPRSTPFLPLHPVSIRPHTKDTKLKGR